MPTIEALCFNRDRVFMDHEDFIQDEIPAGRMPGIRGGDVYRLVFSEDGELVEYAWVGRMPPARAASPTFPVDFQFGD